MYSTGILFAPDEVGEHLVNVLKDGEHIANSPFKLPVGEGNASKVKAWGQGLEEGTANEVNEFTIDTKEAGQNQLNLTQLYCDIFAAQRAELINKVSK